MDKSWEPSFRTRVLVQLLQDIAREDPERVFAAVPNSESPSDGVREITFREALKATDYLARFIDKHFSRPQPGVFETLGFIGASDVRYPFVQYASIKCGYKLLLASFRNTPATNATLIDKAGCSKLLYGSEKLSHVEQVQREHQGLTLVEVPSIQDILSADAEPYPYDVTFEEALTQPITVLHSSGSTGPPKLIEITNGYLSVLAFVDVIEPPQGRQRCEWRYHNLVGKGGRYLYTFPPHHLGGWIGMTIMPVYSVATPLWYPSTAPPDPELILEMIQTHKILGAGLPPSVIETVFHTKGGKDTLKSLNFLWFGGGPLPDGIGNEICKSTRVGQTYGATEFLVIPQLMPEDRKDWAWMEFDPKAHIRMEPAEDDAYELVALPDPDANRNFPGTMALNHAFPGLSEYRSKDLFRQHPTKPGLWKFYGRRDDIVVLSSGAKFNPLPLEQNLTTDDDAIQGALVAGTGESRPALIIEPRDEYRNRSDFEERLWRSVNKANDKLPGYGRIAKDKILISHPDKPFTRAGKGTVIRKQTIKLYENEIKRLFAENDDAKISTGINSALDNANGHVNSYENGQSWDQSSEDIISNVREIITDLIPGVSVQDDSNIFSLGMDSLRTTEAVSSLQKIFGRHDWLKASLLYRNPCIFDISTKVLSELMGKSASETRSTRDMHQMLQKYATFPKVSQRPKTYQAVAVTGTTGSLGAYLVKSLLSSGTVKKIHCLNRSSSAEEQWKDRYAESCSGDETELRFHTVDFTHERLGLPESDFTDLQHCELIIHNAWKVNFLQPLSSFEDNLQGLQNLIGLTSSLVGTKHPRLVYISSISSCIRLNEVPETNVPDFNACEPMGYAESKLVAEQMLNQAAATLHVPVTILRVGQIAGSTNAEDPPWPEQEAFPALFKTSKNLGLIPDNLLDVNWVPINETVSAILELASVEHDGAMFFNVVNPESTAWSELKDTLADHCGKNAKFVSKKSWVQRLKTLNAVDMKNLEEYPALKTLDFFEKLPTTADGVEAQNFVTDRACKESRAMAEMSPVSKTLLDAWLAVMPYMK